MRFDQWVDVEVATDTIDSLYVNRRVDFVKCDTEGREYSVLQGWRRDKPELEDLGYMHVATIDCENMALSARSQAHSSLTKT